MIRIIDGRKYLIRYQGFSTQDLRDAWEAYRLKCKKPSMDFHRWLKYTGKVHLEIKEK